MVLGRLPRFVSHFPAAASQQTANPPTDSGCLAFFASRAIGLFSFLDELCAASRLAAAAVSCEYDLSAAVDQLCRDPQDLVRRFAPMVRYSVTRSGVKVFCSSRAQKHERTKRQGIGSTCPEGKRFWAQTSGRDFLPHEIEQLSVDGHNRDLARNLNMTIHGLMSSARRTCFSSLGVIVFQASLGVGDVIRKHLLRIL
jgi:hypothetical protein